MDWQMFVDYSLTGSAYAWATYFVAGLYLFSHDLLQPKWYRDRAVGGSNRAPVHLHLDPVKLSSLFRILSRNAVLSILVGTVMRALLDPVAQYLHTWVFLDCCSRIPDGGRIVISFLVSLAIADAWFYCSHRLLHTHLLYSRYHKKHHMYSEPFAIVANHSDWQEFVFGNLPTVLLGPIFTLLSPGWFHLWLAGAQLYTLLEHSGHCILPWQTPMHHDNHHALLNCNYGLSRAYDWVGGTLNMGKHTTLAASNDQK